MMIRRAQSPDIPGLIRLLYQVGEVHHQIRPDIFRAGALKYDAPALEALLRDESRPVFIAEEEGRVLGYCFCVHRDYTEGGALVRRREIYIDDLCVEEDCRGQGVARALYDHVCGYAREAGCGFLSLNLWCGNDRARRFYEKMGMTPRSVTMETKL